MIRAAVLVLLLAGCATEPKACAGPEWEWPEYKAKMERAVPGSSWVELTDGERGRFLAEMNSVQPLTGAMYDRIGYFRNPRTQYVMLVYMVDSCVWGHGYVFEGAIRMMIGPKET